MFMMDEDGVHPLIGAIYCNLAVIHIRKSNFTEAKQCLELAEKQFRQIQREMLADGNFTLELIGKRRIEWFSCVHDALMQVGGVG